jgi:hypothetical protein
MSGNNPGDHGNPDTRPVLSIPYWIAPIVPGGRWDDGSSRPLSKDPGIISYMCNSIHPGPYVPGNPLDVQVEVLNSGGGSAALKVFVTVYWADPTVGFAKPTFLTAASVSVQPSRNAPNPATTAVMTGTIPADAPPHVCLVVSVSHAQERQERYVTRRAIRTGHSEICSLSPPRHPARP